jgi:type IV pilus assembly protein PilV
MRNHCLQSRPQRASRRAVAGFSILEVLVAIVVLSIGLIGVAAVQVSTLKFTQVSQQRSAGAQYIMSMTERMRSNLAGVRAGNYAFAQPYAAIPGAIPAMVACAANCTPAQVAQRDLSQWLTELNAALPRGRGVILGDATNAYQITVMWEEKELSAGLTAPCPAVAVAPAEAQCLSATFQP